MDSSREKILKSCAKVRLIEGEPGVGKTWFGCQLAQYELENPALGVQPHQKILFLTFARNAVARTRDVFAQQTLVNGGKAKTFADRVRIDTFCGFFWWLVEHYGRYVKGGTTRRLWLVGSKDIPGVPVPEGHVGVTFDKIESIALRLLSIRAVRRLVSDVYPLIILDEFQDVGDRLFATIEELGKGSRLLLLRGPGQCIYRSLPGKAFSPSEILTRCRESLGAEEFTLKPAGIGRQRHSAELLEFLKRFDSDNVAPPTRAWPVRFTAIERIDRRNVLDFCAGVLAARMREYFKKAGRPRPRIAILASTNQAVGAIHRQVIAGHAGLQIKGQHIRLSPQNASLSFGDNLLLQYGRVILELLRTHWIAKERSELNGESVAVQLAALFQEQKKDLDICTGSWRGLADWLSAKARNQHPPSASSEWEERLKANLSVFNDWIRSTDEDLARPELAGCPTTPFTALDKSLLETLAREFIESIRNTVAAQGRLDIRKAVVAFEKANQQKVIFEKMGIQKNLQVMTIHKSKGREFDGVVLVLEDSHRAIWRQTSNAPHEEIADLYRVAISRARMAFTLVAFEDAWKDAAAPVRRLLPEGLFPRDS